VTSGQRSPCRRYAHTPICPYGVPEGVATGEFCTPGVAVGLASSCTAALGDATGVGVTSGVADEIGVPDVCGLADDCGVTFAAGVLEEFTVEPGIALVFGAAVAVAAGLAFFSSLSSRPTLRSELCLDTKIVRIRVIPKNIPPR
jgi:hypothetical protein